MWYPFVYLLPFYSFLSSYSYLSNMNELDILLIKIAEIAKEPGVKIHLTSKEIAQILHVSQQTASRYLIRLEKEGLITRTTRGRRQEIQITAAGQNSLRTIYRTLNSFLGRNHETILDGEVVSGLSEGAYYIKQYEWKILEALGFRPYPGTLNVRLNSEKPDLTQYSGKKISGFHHAGRQFGALDLVPIELSAKGHRIECYIAAPERTHHKKDLEIISQFNLRTKYNLKDGDRAKVILK